MPAGRLVVVMVSGAVGVTLFDGADSGPFPTEFVAWTVKVYAVPLVRPVTVIEVADPFAVLPPDVEVTVYEVIGLPPFNAGAAKLTVACPLPAVAVTFVGAPGTVAIDDVGVTLFDGADASPTPCPFVAATVKVYAVPLVRPVTVIGLAVPVAVLLPDVEVTVYKVIELPPLAAGGLKLTVAREFPAVAVPIVGALGAVAAETQPSNLNDAIRVLQFHVPLAFRYSFVYQKVQSSTGSTVIAL